LGHVNICNDQNKLTLIYAEIYSGLRKLEIRHVKIRSDQNRLTLAYAEIYSDQSKLTAGHVEIYNDQNNVILPFRGARTTIQRVLRWFKPLKCAIFTQQRRQLNQQETKQGVSFFGNLRLVTSSPAVVPRKLGT